MPNPAALDVCQVTPLSRPLVVSNYSCLVISPYIRVL